MREIINITNSPQATRDLAGRIGARLRGGEVIELSSDIGGGKTEFVRGLAEGAGSPDAVMSPTFTLSRVYNAGEFEIHHYDFYRLDDPGIMRAELAESLHDSNVSVVIEWSNVVADVLPDECLGVTLETVGEYVRRLTLRVQKEDAPHKELIKELG